MAYHDKEEMLKKALEIIKRENLYFIEHLVAFLPISKQTLYQYFPLGSDEMDKIKDEISKNVVNKQSKIYNNWADSDNFPAQVAFIKVTGNNEIRRRLSSTYVEDKEDETKDNIITPIYPEE